MKQKVMTRRGVRWVDLNPRRAIRRHCHICSDFCWGEVASCRAVECELHAFRPGADHWDEHDAAQRRRAIQRYCMDQCSGGNEKLCRNCDMTICPLFSYRLGNPDQTMLFALVEDGRENKKPCDEHITT